MMENLEFWAIFISVLAGFTTVIKQNISMKDSLREEERKREEADRSIHAEFEKCRMHAQCTGKETNA